jgi:MraZ protein
LVFTGTYEHSIDAKKRLAIPSEIRAQILDEESNRPSEQSVCLYVTLGEGQALCLYTQGRFEQRAAELDQSELEAEQLLAYERLMFSLARRVEMDPQGRVRLPENLLAMTGLQSDVVLIGVKDHLEIRDRQAWQEHVRKTLNENPQILMNPRRAMRKPTAAGGTAESH